jgi:hypothetical protein
MELEYLRGSFATAAGLAQELTAAATARNDHRFRAEGLSGEAYCAWQLGNTDETLRALGELRALVAEHPDLTDELKIKAHGLLAMIHLARGDRQQARSASEEAMRLTAQRPTYFGTLFGYVGPVEVYLDRWESGQPRRAWGGQAGEALGRLRRYASVFPVGRPRYGTLRGRHLWLLGKRRDAFSAWHRALTTAKQLSMPFEEALVHLEIARHLEAGDESRQAHVAAARETFERLEARRALDRLDAIVGRSALS